MAVTPDLKELLTPGGVLLGFEVTAFSWRISREMQVAKEGDIVWLAPADYLNLLAMLVTSGGVFVLPALGFENTAIFRILFGLAAILFICHAFALAGHYELYGRGHKHKPVFFPRQEKLAMVLAILVSVLYLVLALLRL